MIHFYISFHFHPTSPPRTGDTLWVFLITAAAVLNFSTEQGGSPALMWKYIAGKMGAQQMKKTMECNVVGEEYKKDFPKRLSPNIYTYVRFPANKV